MGKQRTHQLLITVRFDKPCTKAHAIREARDCIVGPLYPTQFTDDDPGEMKIGAIRSAKAKAV